MSKVFYVGLIFVGLSACHSSEEHIGLLQAALISAANNCTDQPACQIDLKTVIPEQWSKLYWLSYGFHHDPVTDELGPLFGVQHDEFKDKIVLVNNGSILAVDEMPTNVEHAVKNQIVFAHIGKTWSPAIAVNRDNSIVYVTKSVGEYGPVYRFIVPD